MMTSEEERELNRLLEEDLGRDPYQQLALHILNAGRRAGIGDRMSYARKVANNALLSIGREIARERRRQEQHEPILEPDDEPLVESFFDHIADIDHCKRILESLPQELGIALAKHYLHGLSYTEIAAESGETVSCIQKRLHRARSQAKSGDSP